MKIGLDYGHGGKDPGAVGNGLKEKDIVLSVGNKATKILEQHGVEVIHTRTTDVFIDVIDRPKIANKEKVDMLASLHVNAFTDTGAQGLEVFHFQGSAKGKELAQNVLNSITKDKLYTKNRGIKTANFAVLKLSKMPAILIELGFITNKEDANILKNKQDELAQSVAKGMLNSLGIKYIGDSPGTQKPNKGIPIISKTKTTIDQMQEWAKRKGANQLFVDLAPLFYKISSEAGVNPLVTYTQSAKETGYMKFSGVLNASYNNPCGLKIKAGGGDKDPGAHHRFKDWEEGIQAQVDHLALYAGAPGYPKANTPDPRHFPFIKGKATTVEELSGNWVPSPTYGTDIVKMIKELELTVSPTKPKEPNQAKIKVNIFGSQQEAKGVLKNGTNYVNVKGEEIPLRDIFEAMGFEVSWDSSKGVAIK